MEIPKKIKVGGHEIRIDICDTAHIANRGNFSNYHNIIRLEKETDTPEDNVAECFLHEIIECIKAKNNLTIGHVELTVLSEFLFQVLKDNKLIFYES